MRLQSTDGNRHLKFLNSLLSGMGAMILLFQPAPQSSRQAKPGFTGQNLRAKVGPMKTQETILTSKGTTRIPKPILKAAGLMTGSRLVWDFQGGEIRARRKDTAASRVQSHIRKYAGTWDGHCSGEELLRRTRP